MRSIQACAHHLVREEIEGTEYWSGADGPGGVRGLAPDGRAGGGASPRVLLLQAFDELTVAYKDRSAYFESLLPKDSGVLALGPTVFVDGRIAGSWRRSVGKDAVSVKVRLLRELGKDHRRALATAARDYGRFLGKQVNLET